MESMKQLQDVLTSVTPGNIDDAAAARVLRALGCVWSDLHRTDDEATEPWKLGRAEHLRWCPPILSFVLERHGAACMGSTRAELHHWEVDVEHGTAAIVDRGRRQLKATQPRLDILALVTQVVDAVVRSADEPWLSWSADRLSVRVIIGELIPDDGFKQTVQGRRKRFKTKLDEFLSAVGWARERHATRLIYRTSEGQEP
jgi:hypothetical protein